jgi:hypothetical protein
MGVTSRVINRLGRNAVSRHLDGRGQVIHLIWRIDLDRKAPVLPPLGETTGVLTERFHKADLVQCRRAQPIDEPTDLRDRRADFGSQLS